MCCNTSVKSRLHNPDIIRVSRFKCGHMTGISPVKQVRQAIRPYTTYRYYACRQIPVYGVATSTKMGCRKILEELIITLGK